MNGFTPTVSLQSYANKSLYIRHRDFEGVITEVDSDLDKQDATFYAGGPTDRVRLQAAYAFGKVSRDLLFLRHFRFVVHLEREDLAGSIPTPTPAQDQFTADTSFRLTFGLADATCVSFQSLGYPDRYLRHRDYKLYVEPASDDTARQDATFRVVPGLAPVPAPVLR